MNSRLLNLLTNDSLQVAGLEKIYAAQSASPNFAVDALWAARQLDADLAWRAVWLLKRLAKDRRLTDADLRQIALCADEMSHWASRLEVCQLFSMTGCPADVRETLYPFLIECFADRHVVIRAWAITVLAGFRDQPKFRNEVEKRLRQARSDSGKAMIARLRHLPKITLLAP